MAVYIEVIILDNFIIDYIILRVCCMKERRNFSRWRLIVAAVLGVVIAFLALLEMRPLAMFAIKIFGSLAMVYIAFGKARFWRMLFDFYFFTFAIGGTAMALLYIKEGTSIAAVSGLENIPTGIIIGSIFCGYFIAKRVIYIFNEQNVQDGFVYQVEMYNNGASLLISGFLDSGNLLVFKDDMRGVCVGEYRKFAAFFKGQKPWGQVLAQTAAGNEMLNVYRIAVLKIRKLEQGAREDKDSIVILEEVAFALSKVGIAKDFDVLLSPMMFY